MAGTTNVILKQIFAAIIMICIGASFFYFLYIHRDITPPDHIEKWCSNLVYFNTSKHKFDTTYTQTTLFGGDSIVNFTSPKGDVWQQKQFVVLSETENDDKENVYDITVENGERFKLILVDSGACKIKSVMDSIKISNQPDNDNN